MQQEQRPLAGYALPIREPTQQPSAMMLAAMAEAQGGSRRQRLQVNPEGQHQRSTTPGEGLQFSLRSILPLHWFRADNCKLTVR